MTIIAGTAARCCLECAVQWYGTEEDPCWVCGEPGRNGTCDTFCAHGHIKNSTPCLKCVNDVRVRRDDLVDIVREVAAPATFCLEDIAGYTEEFETSD